MRAANPGSQHPPVPADPEVPQPVTVQDVRHLHHVDVIRVIRSVRYQLHLLVVVGTKHHLGAWSSVHREGDGGDEEVDVPASLQVETKRVLAREDPATICLEFQISVPGC